MNSVSFYLSFSLMSNSNIPLYTLTPSLLVTLPKVVQRTSYSKLLNETNKAESGSCRAILLWFITAAIHYLGTAVIKW